jgi:hypothetical protein
MTLRQRIKFFFIRKAAKLLITLLIFTCRIRISGEAAVDELRKKKIPIIYIYWHRHIFFTIHKFKNSGARPLISLSPDGEIVSQVALEFGMNPVRGSSSRGGARAFLHLVNSVKESFAIAGNSKINGRFTRRLSRRSRNTEISREILITADGPKGPLKEIKDGTILLAQKTGAVIIPFCWYSTRVKALEKSWDRFLIPLPFGAIMFKYGSPFFISREAGRDELAGLKKKLKEALDDLETSLENAAPAISGGNRKKK